MYSQKKLWNDKWKVLTPTKVNSFAKRSLGLIKENRYNNLLDVGCGLGQDAVYFSDNGLKVTAVDFSKEGLERIPKNLNLKTVAQDITELNFKKNTFDVIYSHLSIHYFDNKTTDKIFTKLFEILKPNGMIFLKCKSIDDEYFGRGSKVDENIYIDDNHVRHFFSKEYMFEKLAKFKNVKIRKTSSVYKDYKSSFIEAIAQK